MAAVLTNPNMAINKAASKYRVVPEEIPNKMINAMLLMYMVSSAKMRSGLLGPINKRHKLRTNDKQTSVVAIMIAVLSI
jgi:hypothetical protein